MPYVLSVSTLAFDGHSFEDTCDAIAKAGGTHVEPAFVASYGRVDEGIFTTREAQRMAGVIAAAGLKCVTLSAHVDSGADDAVGRLQRRLDFAAALGAKHLITNAGSTGSDAQFEDNMIRLASHARWCGVTLCLENPGDPGSLFVTADDVVLWMNRLGHPSIGVNYDCGNAFTATNGAVDPAHDILKILPGITHLHLKDFRRTQEGLRPCAVGSGILRYDAILETLAAQPSIPPMSLEMPLRMVRSTTQGVTKGPVLPLGDVVSIVRDALGFVQRSLRTATSTSF